MLTINDLSTHKELDRDAMKSIEGGSISLNVKRIIDGAALISPHRVWDFFKPTPF